MYPPWKHWTVAQFTVLAPSTTSPNTTSPERREAPRY
jgi:hypothetical protein